MFSNARMPVMYQDGTRPMVDWPQAARAEFGKSIIEARHSIHNSPLFCDGSLAALLDLYPRDQLGIWTFADHGEGEEAPVKGEAPDMSGEELLEAVKNGRIWLNLRATNSHVADYAPIADQVFNSIQYMSGQRVLKRDMGVLISSPNVHVHYHLDIPMVALFQVRGEKTVWFYPPTERFAPAAHVEAIALREKEEGLPYSASFDLMAQEFPLRPGMGVTWPQTAPHRVQNGNMLNVSLSCEFMTLPALIKANATYANGRLRRDFGARPSRAHSVSAGTVSKALLARAFKRVGKPQNSAAVTPATFAVDLAAPNCTRALI